MPADEGSMKRHLFPARGQVFDLWRVSRVLKIDARLCVVVSPDTLNAHRSTVMVAALGIATNDPRYEVACRFDAITWHVRCREVHTLPSGLLREPIRSLSPDELARTLEVLGSLLAPSAQ